MKRTREEAAETREALLAAAMTVFARRGFAAATLAEIGQQAGVTRGALYHHFDDKVALLAAATARRWELVGQQVWDELNSDRPAAERVRGFVDTFYRLLATDSRFQELVHVTIASGEQLAPGSPMEAKVNALGQWIDRLTDAFEEVDWPDGQPPQPARAAAMTVVATLTGMVLLHAMTLSSARKNTDGDGAERLTESTLAGLLPG